MSSLIFKVDGDRCELRFLGWPCRHVFHQFLAASSRDGIRRASVVRVTLNSSVAQPFSHRPKLRPECTRLTNNKPARWREAFCRLNTPRENNIWSHVFFFLLAFFLLCFRRGRKGLLRGGAALLAILVTLDVRFNGCCCLFLLFLFARFFAFLTTFLFFPVFLLSRVGKF